jgi:hypothetical protein
VGGFHRGKGGDSLKRQGWKRKIKKQCEEAGTYRPFFDSVIDSLAGIMETRDNAQEKYIASGGQSVVVHTNKAGASNIVKNPALVVLMECNAQALQYWTALGLTARSYKQLFNDMQPQEGKRGLEDVLGELGI